MNTTKKRTSTGLAAHISLNGAVRCGGAVVNHVRTNQGANSANMFSKETMTRRKKRIKKSKRKCSGT